MGIVEVAEDGLHCLAPFIGRTPATRTGATEPVPPVPPKADLTTLEAEGVKLDSATRKKLSKLAKERDA